MRLSAKEACEQLLSSSAFKKTTVLTKVVLKYVAVAGNTPIRKNLAANEI